MRNVLPIVVGVIIAGGAGVALYSAVGDNEPSRPSQAATTMPASDTTTQVASAPKAAASLDDVPISADDFILGKKDAPVTIVEYASMTCPHCAQFHKAVLPVIKKDYIEKGLVRLVYRDFPLDNMALTASVVARCSGQERYFAFVDVIFAQMDKWARDSNPVAGLSRIARLGGMSQTEFDACMKNEEITKKVLEQRLEANKKYGVQSTPSLIVNGDFYSGGLSVDQLRAVIDAKLKSKLK